jgi:hypothetical protein
LVRIYNPLIINVSETAKERKLIFHVAIVMAVRQNRAVTKTGNQPINERLHESGRKKKSADRGIFSSRIAHLNSKTFKDEIPTSRLKHSFLPASRSASFQFDNNRRQHALRSGDLSAGHILYIAYHY